MVNSICGVLCVVVVVIVVVVVATHLYFCCVIFVFRAISNMEYIAIA